MIFVYRYQRVCRQGIKSWRGRRISENGRERGVWTNYMGWFVQPTTPRAGSALSSSFPRGCDELCPLVAAWVTTVADINDARLFYHALRLSSCRRFTLVVMQSRKTIVMFHKHRQPCQSLRQSRRLHFRVGMVGENGELFQLILELVKSIETPKD